MNIKKFKTSYNLEYIEKLFRVIPLVFIFILAVLSILITYFILESKEKRDIDLLIQKKKIHNEFQKKEQLQNFVTEVSFYVEEEINTLKTEIKKSTYRLIGNLDLLFSSEKSSNEINVFLTNYEKKHDVEVTLFEKKSLSIVYGKENIFYLGDLIFGSHDETRQKLVLQYVSSQGKNNLQTWKNDLKGTLRLSFFDTVKIGDKEYYLGSFSKVKNIKFITKNIITQQIKALENKEYTIWLLDLITNESYNYFGNNVFVHAKDIKKNKTLKSEILNYYIAHELETKEYEKNVYFNSLFNYMIAIDYNLNTHVNTKEITAKYNQLLYTIVIYIFFFSVILILFSFLFSNFIKNILDKYNKKLEKRTDSLLHWKNRFELAIIASNDGLWDIDFSTNKIYFSSKWLEIAGYEKNEVLTFSDWFNLIHNEDKKGVEEVFEKIFAQTEDIFVGEYRLKTKHDGYKWILARGRVFIDKQTNTRRMLMMSMDIDKSKRMKKELLDVELLVEDGKIVIFKLFNNKELSVKYISNSIKNYGYTKKDFEENHLNFMDLIYKEDISLVQVAINAALKKDLSDFTFVCRATNASNDIRWISCRTIVIKNHSGEVINFYGYINDITKIKVSEEELKLEVEKEVIKNRDKDKMLIQQSKLAAMGEMIGSIAHQWRQPLNNTSLMLQFLRDNYSNKDIAIEKIDKYFSRANVQIKYMSETIDDFRNFYKPSKSMNAFDLKQAIEASLDIIKVQLKDENIVIDFSCETQMVFSYENELKQSLLNIFNNAKDAIITRRKTDSFDGVLSIAVIKDIKNVRLEISNNGGSIPLEIIDRVFEPYFTTKFETQGTGIGLYMTKTIIETNMKGSIVVENILDGVKFIITLPIDKEKK